MLVRDWMSKKVLSIGPRDGVERAREILETNRIHQLPVLAKGKLIGIVSDRDLRDAFPSVFDAARRDATGEASYADPAEIRVESIMSQTVLTTRPEETVATAARVMLSERVGALPVLDGHKLVGILTRSDALRALINFDEAEERSRVAAS